MTTIVSLLRGKPALSKRWVDCLLRQNTDNSEVIIGAATDADVEIAAQIGARVFPTETYQGADEVGRINHIASIYEMILPQVTTDHVILWEDDILPPPNGIAALVANKDKADAITSVVPFRKESQVFPGVTQVMLFYVDGKGPSTIQSLPKSGLDEIFYGGSAFSIWKTSSIQETLPWVVQTEENGRIPGWDEILARRFRASDKKTMVDLSIRCYHG